jgi:GGDEF domain-containing protein
MTTTQEFGSDITPEDHIAYLAMLAAKERERADATTEQNRELAYLAYHDELTGLLNRRGWAKVVGGLIESAKQRGVRVAVLNIDLDHFKGVNDTLGHSAGDEILQKMAAVANKSIRTSDDKRQPDLFGMGRQELDDESPEDHQAARQGGDEFEIALYDTDEEGVQIVLDRLRKNFDDMFGADEHLSSISFDMSVGYSILEPGSDMSAEQLIEQADQQMYADKLARKSAAI